MYLGLHRLAGAARHTGPFLLVQRPDTQVASMAACVQHFRDTADGGLRRVRPDQLLGALYWPCQFPSPTYPRRGVYPYRVHKEAKGVVPKFRR